MGHLVGWAGGACHKFGMGEGPSPATPTGGAQKSGDNLEDTHQRPKRKQQSDVSIINIAACGHLHVCVRVRRHWHHARLVNQRMPPPTGSHCATRNATLILIRHRTRAVLVHMSIPRPRPSCLVASGATALQIPHRKGSWSREDPPTLCCRLCRHRSQAKPPRLPWVMIPAKHPAFVLAFLQAPALVYCTAGQFVVGQAPSCHGAHANLLHLPRFLF